VDNSPKPVEKPHIYGLNGVVRYWSGYWLTLRLVTREHGHQRDPEDYVKIVILVDWLALLLAATVATAAIGHDKRTG
jgi:hypothetical protein